jgi:protein phosphatase
MCIRDRGSSTYLFIVADGMGGHSAGEVASNLAVAEIVSYVKENVMEVRQKGLDIAELIKNAILHANDQIYKKSLQHSECLGMGTTLSMVLALDNMLYIGHVGDSRVYIIRDQSIIRLTEDHSLVAELVKNGTIKPEDASNHPQKNIITRAVGTEYTIEVDSSSFELNDGDTIILCTDGLTNQISDRDILNIVMEAPGIDVAAEKLISTAKDSGGYDNITVVVIKNCKGGDCNDR